MRNDVGVFDVSHMGEFVLRGPNAIALIQKFGTNDASVLVDGKAQYNCMPNGKGGIVDDLIIYRENENEYFIVVNASNIEKDWNWITSLNDLGVEMENLSDNYSSSQWYFGDGGTSILTNPTYNYTAYGKFNVKLVVTSCFKNKKDSITFVKFVSVDSY